MKQVSPFPRPIEVGAIGEDGRVERIVANEAECAAIAAEHGVVAVGSFAADIELRRQGGGLITLDGRLRSDVVQTCVVSLEPVPQKIDHAFRMSFAMAGSEAAPPAPRPGAEVLVNPESDPPDLLGGTTIDLGGVLLEQFSLALDPYPRAPGAAIQADAGPAEDQPESPFAALAALKTPRS